MEKNNFLKEIGGLIAYVCLFMALILLRNGINKQFEAQSVQLDALKTQVEAFCNGYVPCDTVFEYKVMRDTIVEYKVIPQ